MVARAVAPKTTKLNFAYGRASLAVRGNVSRTEDGPETHTGKTKQKPNWKRVMAEVRASDRSEKEVVAASMAISCTIMARKKMAQ